MRSGVCGGPLEPRSRVGHAGGLHLGPDHGSMVPGRSVRGPHPCGPDRGDGDPQCCNPSTDGSPIWSTPPVANGGPAAGGAPSWCEGGRTSPVSGVWARSTVNWSSCSASSPGARESRRYTPAVATMTQAGVPQRSCPSPRGGPPMGTRIAERLAAALGHAPHGGGCPSRVVMAIVISM